jgi:hypothetical protein
MADLFAAGASWESTVPKGLKAGNYLVRHEMQATLIIHMQILRV